MHNWIDLLSSPRLAFPMCGRKQLFRKRLWEKSAREHPERYCGWFWVHCSSKKSERMAREAMEICLRVLKESNKSRFESYSVRNSELIVSHTTFRDCRVQIFSDSLSRNSCISGMRRSVSSPHKRLRRELKKWRAEEYFWRTSRCFIWWWSTVSNAWYYFSNKTILEGQMKDAKMSSFPSVFQTLININFLCIFFINY